MARRNPAVWALVAALMAGAAVASASGPRQGTPRPSATPTPGWNDGPSFRDETACYTYGSKEVWPVWECHRDGRVWTFRYWIEPATTRDV